MIAAVTMVYNEPEFIPLWIDYYGKQVGLENCFIVDNGTDDGSIDEFKNVVNVIRVPREFKDNSLRTKFLSEFCSSLLHYFSHVIHVDVDEFIVANPLKYSGLVDYTNKWKGNRSSVTSIGLNVTQLPSLENEIDFGSKILNQRSFARFITPMCKPCIISKPIEWTSGFHGSNHEIVFDDIFMFHLRYFDLNYGLKRLERTRNMKWKSDKEGLHQRVEDETWNKWFVSFERFPKKGDVMINGELNPVLSSYLKECIDTQIKEPSGKMRIPMMTPNTLFEITNEFKSLF